MTYRVTGIHKGEVIRTTVATGLSTPGAADRTSAEAVAQGWRDCRVQADEEAPVAADQDEIDQATGNSRR